MGTELISQESVFMYTKNGLVSGDITVKRGSYKHGMLLIHLSSAYDNYHQMFLSEKQVIALIQTLAASLDYSREGHMPHPIRWPETHNEDEE